MAKQTKKQKRGPIQRSPLNTLMICADCRIKLVVSNDHPKHCGLCKSLNITWSIWR